MSFENSQRNLSSPEVRRETFKSYPKTYPDITQLVEAGFYYVGSEDECQCHLCAVRLFNWDRNDDPMSEHRKYRPDCEIFNLKATSVKEASHDSGFKPENCYTPQPGTVIPDSSGVLPNNYKTERTQVHTDYSSSMTQPPIASHEIPPLVRKPEPYYNAPPPNGMMGNQAPHPLPSHAPHQYPARTHPSTTMYHPQTYPQLPHTYFTRYPPTVTATFMPRNYSNSPHYAPTPRPMTIPFTAPTYIDPRFAYPHRV